MEMNVEPIDEIVTRSWTEDKGMEHLKQSYGKPFPCNNQDVYIDIYSSLCY
jgi:hypothetical protein